MQLSVLGRSNAEVFKGINVMNPKDAKNNIFVALITFL